MLVCLVLFVFLGRIRPARLWQHHSAVTARDVYRAEIKGIPANLLSLGAMDFGIIVDGAVIVVENIFRRVSHDRDQFKASKNSSRKGRSEVGRPTFFSMLIISLPTFRFLRCRGVRAGSSRLWLTL